MNIKKEKINVYKTGKFAIVNSTKVLTVIQVVDDINNIDLEKVREQYFNK